MLGTITRDAIGRSISSATLKTTISNSFGIAALYWWQHNDNGLLAAEGQGKKNFGNFRWRKTKLYKRIIPMKIFGLPGTSFSPRRALGIDVLKRKIAIATGIPTTKQGIEKKIGKTVIKGVKSIFDKWPDNPLWIKQINLIR